MHDEAWPDRPLTRERFEALPDRGDEPAIRDLSPLVAVRPCFRRPLIV